MFLSDLVLLLSAGFYDDGTIMINAAQDLADDFDRSKRKGCNEAAIIGDQIQKYADAAEEYFSYVGESRFPVLT
jgi:hypothetical protein